MTNFDEAMDGILVQNKILEETMMKNLGDNQQEIAVDAMFNQMKKELINEISDLNPKNGLPIKLTQFWSIFLLDLFTDLQKNPAMAQKQVQQNKLQN